MHIAQAVRITLQRSRSRSDDNRGARRQGCFGICSEIGGSKFFVTICLALIVVSAVFCIGLFEATRLTTHVLRSPCTITATELVDVGTCTMCDGELPANCEVHPVTTARLSVNLRHRHSQDNITGYVWYCKNRVEEDPCLSQLGFLDQLALDVTTYSDQLPPGGPIPCTTAEVLNYVNIRLQDTEDRECYYSSRDLKGEDVWFSMPSPGLADHAWFQKHLEYPVLLALGGLVLLTILLGCLAVEGAELWFSGIV
mmetsp:Transcript_76802/g.138552  ORF Transcript_76802/g.138552 Transcript_76802/m.138552 type:complete len:254 (-) Transcript_76802:35-796(-)